jgi:superfamily II helicase
MLVAATDAALATSALEFLRAETDNNEARLMKEIVIKLVAKGYKNVPDWVRLSSITRKKILEKGYTNQDIEAIAEEAALANGMTR